MGQYNLQCDECDSKKFYSLVNYGSYILKCADCLATGPVTSFISIEENLKGKFEFIEVDESMNQIQVIGVGHMVVYSKTVNEAASAGKIVWLKPLQ